MIEKTIFIVEKNYLSSEGLKAILENNYPNFNIILLDVEELLEKLIYTSCDLLILNIDLPYNASSTLIKAIFEKVPHQPILVVCKIKGECLAQLYFKLGILGYIDKKSSREILIESVELSLQGKRYLNEAPKNHDVTNQSQPSTTSNFYNLSSREQEVFFFLLEGMGNLEISNSLGLKPSTIATYRTRIFNKWNVSNVIELYKKASNLGLV